MLSWNSYTFFFVPSSSRSGARLTKAYDVTIKRYRDSHAKIQDSEMLILRCIGSIFFFYEISKLPFEISHKIWNPYTVKCILRGVKIWRLMTSYSYDILRLSETGPDFVQPDKSRSVDSVTVIYRHVIFSGLGFAMRFPIYIMLHSSNALYMLAIIEEPVRLTDVSVNYIYSICNCFMT